MSGIALGAPDTVGLAAGMVTTLAFVPQLWRIVRTHSAFDISWGTFASLALGSALWLWYGIRLSSLPLVATNVVTLSLQMPILYLKWRYGRGPRAAAGLRKEPS